MLTVLIAALCLVVAGCGDEKKDSRDSGGGGQTTGASTAPPAAPQASSGCERVKAPPPKEDGGQKKPKRKLVFRKTYRLIFQTNCGSFGIELDQTKAPNATASLYALANADFFDNTTIHRISPGFVIQGGDPTGTGTGGPGYSTRDKVPSNAKYTKGVVAMAKTPEEPPGTAGSQFYVVTGEDAGLPPDYAIVGKIVYGEEAVEKIGKLGDASERPTQPIVVRNVVTGERE